MEFVGEHKRADVLEENVDNEEENDDELPRGKPMRGYFGNEQPREKEVKTRASVLSPKGKTSKKMMSSGRVSKSRESQMQKRDVPEMKQSQTLASPPITPRKREESKAKIFDSDSLSLSLLDHETTISPKAKAQAKAKAKAKKKLKLKQSPKSRSGL
ncbi:cell envelope integrity inner membrane protein TolA, partial [Reticulomyxa filosa]